MRWQKGALKVVILMKMVMLTKIAKNPQSLTCKSNEEAKSPPPPPKKWRIWREIATAILKEMANLPKKWLKFAKGLYRSNEIDELGENGQRVNLSKKLPEGWRKFK